MQLYSNLILKYKYIYIQLHNLLLFQQVTFVSFREVSSIFVPLARKERGGGEIFEGKIIKKTREPVGLLNSRPPIWLIRCNKL